MPWLSELVESSEGSLDVLPIQCLCEFLLMSNGDSKSDDPKAKHSQVFMFPVHTNSVHFTLLLYL